MNNIVRKKLPIGIDNFEKLRVNGFYYVDKTLLIRDLLNGSGEVNLFTRPRRFGKSLNMSMLHSFFDINGDKSVFDGLAISGEKELCDEHMGKFPMVLITLKNIEGLTYEKACLKLLALLHSTIQSYQFLMDSEKLSSIDKQVFSDLFTNDNIDYVSSSGLYLLTKYLNKHYDKNVIVLIDEYDVPLDKAYNSGYYDEMVSLVRSMFGQVLKSNDYLQFAVLTGCLRISKESIFTGLNNLKVFSIADENFDEYFGFTECEVDTLLEYYKLQDHKIEIKEWYDGYHFGMQDVYCPWDVINYCYDLITTKNARIKSYWINTSGNEMVRRLINKTRTGTERMEIEQLIAGEIINKSINDRLTHNEIDKNINNLWSVLYMTGYLTTAEYPKSDTYNLVIPNKEVRQIFNEQVLEWFNDRVAAQADKLTDLFKAFTSGDTEKIEEIINIQLFNTISYHDEYESFYHGFLIALLSTCADWSVRSNRENGIGRSDISIESFDGKLGIVIELKIAKKGNFTEACAEALQQIEDRDYTANFRQLGIEKILEYGIAFYNKRCCVIAKKLS